MAEAGILERSLSISLGTLIFALLLPYMIVVGGLHLDRSLGFPQLGVMWMLLGALLVTLGLPLAAWSVYIQHSLGKGTPVPMVPTQRLIVTGPYRYCRNPMAFVTFLAYYWDLYAVSNGIWDIHYIAALPHRNSLYQARGGESWQRGSALSTSSTRRGHPSSSLGSGAERRRTISGKIGCDYRSDRTVQSEVTASQPLTVMDPIMKPLCNVTVPTQ